MSTAYLPPGPYAGQRPPARAAMHAARRDRLRGLLAGCEADAALVTDLVNVRYLTGFTGSNAAVLVAAEAPPGGDLFATDGRYVDQAAAQCPDLHRLTTRTLVHDLMVHSPGITRLAVETHVLSVDAHHTLLAQVDVPVVSLQRGVERLREVKDEVEIATLAAACSLSTEALQGLWAGPLVGRTEREIARDLEARMLALGAEWIAFDTIVASGPNSAIPHHEPTGRVVEAGDLLKTDFGARVDGYHADCTRTVVVGTEPTGWQREIHAAVQAAQWAGVQAMAADAPVAEPDAVARQVLDDAGWLERFTTGSGHGVGLQIHEDPFVGPRHPGRLHDRTPVTMEPGVYLPGRGGVRIEDTLVVGPGGPSVLTDLPRGLLVVG
ncbi:Xaa-Pro peptidase family protein [soil metagenome]